MNAQGESLHESRMRESRTSGSTRGGAARLLWRTPPTLLKSAVNFLIWVELARLRGVCAEDLKINERGILEQARILPPWP